MSAQQISNPTRWFYAQGLDAEWWGLGGETRDACISAAREKYGDEELWIVEAKRMVPDIDVMHLFDGNDLVDRMQDDECWGEEGWEGAGDTDELERRLTATLKQWFNETCSLTGAQLDFTNGPERVQSGTSELKPSS